MATMKTIKDEIKSVLTSNKPLNDFIKGSVFDGVREKIIDYPCIIIEPMQKSESDETYNTQHIRGVFSIIGYVKSMSPKKQLDDVFDFENKVLVALGSDRYLNGNAEIVRITETLYDFELYPVRNFSIQVEVEFRQNSSTRT